MNDFLFGLMLMFGMLFIFVGIPFFFIALVFSCTAWSRTRTWRKEKAKHFAKLADIEMDGLIPEEDESEDEPLDSDDEREITARKEAQKQDWDLTSAQKFKKELKRSWTGNDNKEAAAKKEREERAKIAREVAREMMRAERKRAKKAKKTQGKAQEAMEDHEEGGSTLPTYDVATASSS